MQNENEKYYRNRTDNIINYELQGWPIFKMNIRDILKELGAKLVRGKWVIPESDALDIYPILVEDDGMGYGVHEQFISEVSYHPEPDNQSDSKFCTIFREKEIENLDLWNNAKFYPNAEVLIKGHEYSTDPKIDEISCTTKIRKNDDGEYEYYVETRTYKEIDLCKVAQIKMENKYYKESELDWV